VHATVIVVLGKW